MTDPTVATPHATLAADMPWWVLPGLAALVLFSLDGVVIAAFWTGDATLKPVLATGLLNLAVGALGYFFGSSAGSARKDGTIAAQSDKLAVSTPPQA